MFTGIVEALGHITAIEQSSQGARVTVHSETLDFNDVQLGDSIATNGVCLTVVSFTKHSYTADVSSETLAHTGFASYQVGQRVNLEKAMLPTTRFGGHMVSGHVDGRAKILAINTAGNSNEYWLSIPAELAPYIAHKGSVTIDGVSLTVNSVEQDKFRLTIVPHTAQQTIISGYQVGHSVNLEVDVIARYIERLLSCQQSQDKSSPNQSNITESLLRSSGFIQS